MNKRIFASIYFGARKKTIYDLFHRDFTRNCVNGLFEGEKIFTINWPVYNEKLYRTLTTTDTKIY